MSRFPIPRDITLVAHNVGYSFNRCAAEGAHTHTIDCIWVWHNCPTPLGENTVAPGEEWGWRPTGVGAHTLVQLEPLTLTASLYWPDCCGLHGFITDGWWIDA